MAECYFFLTCLKVNIRMAPVISVTVIGEVELLVSRCGKVFSMGKYSTFHLNRKDRNNG